MATKEGWVSRFRRLSFRARLLLAVLAAALLWGGLRVLDHFTVSRAERFEAWLEQAASQLPGRQWEEYQQYLAWPGRDVFIHYAGRSYDVKAADEAGYGFMARGAQSYLRGSTVRIVATEVNDDPQEPGVDISARLLVEWRPRGVEAGGGRYSLGTEVKAFETPTGFAAVAVRVFSAGEMVDFMGDQFIDFLRNRGR